ncbi:MAG: hypothetical protein J0I19_15900 [Alphaproteobacteria bacterium]|nr:hypothetical protein [Alphaproteobacteria bacterium]
MEQISYKDALECERLSKAQRLSNAHYLRFDETKAGSARDVMLLHRVRAAAAEKSDAFDRMLGEPEVNRLFNDGAIYIERGVANG